MQHCWTDTWLGRPWVEGTFECVHLVIDVYRARFGVHLDLPRPEETHRGRHAQWGRLATHLADPVSDAKARDGDVAHLCAAGHPTAHHLGLLVAPPGGERRILHCARELGTCLHTPRTLRLLGWHLHSYYRPRLEEPVNGMAY